jgi:protein-disulfide isomerase
MFELGRSLPPPTDLKFAFCRSTTTPNGFSLETPVNRRIAVFAPGAVAFIAFLAVSSFSISGTHLGLEAAIAADDQAAPAKDAAPAPAKEAAPAPAESALPDMAIGKADAPITIVEYSSLSCPHCGAFHKDVLPSLKSEYIDTGKVRYVEREFPLNNSALAGAVLARCIDPSRFFAFTDLLFSRQEDWAFKEDALQPLRLYAKQAGLNDADFDKCIDDEALQKKILAVRDRGEKEGVHGTPTFFINGKIFNGAPTLQALAEAIKPYLSTQ